MSEYSYPFDGVSVGDCGPYGADDWAQLERDLFYPSLLLLYTPTLLTNYAITVSPGALPATGHIHIGIGAYKVYGHKHINTSTTPPLVPNAYVGAGTRIDTVVLRLDWSAGTVRIVIIEGTAGVAPTMEANPGVLWDIPLWDISITAASGLLDLSYAVDRRITPLTITIPYRQGGSSTDWSVGGTTNYAPLRSMIEQVGVYAWSIPAGGWPKQIITYPTAFKYPPILTIEVHQATEPADKNQIVDYMWVIDDQSSASQFVLQVQVGYSAANNVNVHWRAIGEAV